MRIETRTLGPIEIDDDRILKFVAPMLGMEGVIRCALLDLNPESPVKLLQVTDDPDRCFLVADPGLLFPDYRVSVTQELASELGLEDPAEAAVLVILNLKAPSRLTANLLGPIVVNAQTFLAKQIVLQGSGYQVDEPVGKAFGEG